MIENTRVKQDRDLRGAPDLLSVYLSRIGQGDLLTQRQESDLSRRAKKGDGRARRRLIEKNLRLVVSVAKKIRALSRARTELSGEPRRDPTDEELARRLGWMAHEVRDATDAAPDAGSLNDTLSSGSGVSELVDFVRDERSSDVADAVVRDVETARMLDALGELPERSRYVLARRYGLGNVTEASIGEISEELSVSRKKVTRMQDEAERSLRTKMCRRSDLKAAV